MVIQLKEILISHPQDILISAFLITKTHFHLIQITFFLHSQINIALKKLRGNVTAGMLSQQNLSTTVNKLIASDKAFVFMNQIKRFT